MTLLLPFLSFLLVANPASATEPILPYDVDLDNPTALQEATRILTEEVKLAAKPQTYVVIDLATQTIIFKDRGVELHRIPITSWSATAREGMAGTLRLIARPAVMRRKIDPNVSPEQEPISLADMPTQYALSWTPPMTIEVLSFSSQDRLRSLVLKVKVWWRRIQDWAQSILLQRSKPVAPHLQLVLSEDQAQSLAWSLVDGMSLVIRRPTDK
jgi:hypothetical protein